VIIPSLLGGEQGPLPPLPPVPLPPVPLLLVVVVVVVVALAVPPDPPVPMALDVDVVSLPHVPSVLHTPDSQSAPTWQPAGVFAAQP
jgi:hypothetical protein